MGSVMWQTCCIVGKQAVMICANHICLEVLFCLMMTVWNAGAIENDTEPENSLHKTIRKLTEVWNSSCTSDLLNTNRSDNAELERKNLCDKIRCLGGMGPGSEVRSHNDLTGSFDYEDNIDDNVNGDDGTTADDDDDDDGTTADNDDDDEGCENCDVPVVCRSAFNEKTETCSPKDVEKCLRRTKIRMKRMRRECDEKMNQQNNGCTGKPGVLVLTHLIAVAIGAGVLYCVLFMKKIKRTLKGRIKDERNKETNSVSHNQQKGSMENLSTPCLKEDEGVYCEVAEKPQPKSSQFANFAYSVAEDSVLEGRKNLRLPDIPQQAMKDDNQYLTPISRSLPNEYLDSSGKALKDENEIWSEDEKVQNSNVLNHDDRLNDAFDTETIDNYFVLENSTDMDLK